MHDIEKNTILEILEYISEQEKKCYDEYGEIPYDIYCNKSFEYEVVDEIKELRERLGVPYTMTFDELQSDDKKLRGMQKAIDDLKQHEHG